MSYRKNSSRRSCTTHPGSYTKEYKSHFSNIRLKFTLLLLKDGLESRGVVVIGLDNRWCVNTVTGLDIRCVEDVMKFPLGECVSRLGDGDDEKLRGLPAMFRVEVS